VSVVSTLPAREARRARSARCFSFLSAQCSRRCAHEERRRECELLSARVLLLFSSDAADSGANGNDGGRANFANSAPPPRRTRDVAAAPLDQNARPGGDVDRSAVAQVR